MRGGEAEAIGVGGSLMGRGYLSGWKHGQLDWRNRVKMEMLYGVWHVNWQGWPHSKSNL